MFQSSELRSQFLFARAASDFFAKPFAPARDALVQKIEVLVDRSGNFPKMWKVKIRRVQLADLGDRFPPRFDMQFRRNKGWDRRTAADSNTGHITAENIIIPIINMMMTRVTRCCDGANFKRRDTNNLIVFEDFDALGRNRREATPKPLHVVAENPGRRFNQLRRVDQMR